MMKMFFENHLCLNKAVLLEWYGEEFGRNHPVYRAVNIVLLAVTLAGTVFIAAVGTMMDGTYGLVLGIAMVLMLVVVLGNLLFRQHLLVWLMLRRDKGRNYPADLVMLIDEAQIHLLKFSKGDAPVPQSMSGYLLGVEGLQADFATLMAEGEKLTPNLDALENFRDRLETLKQRMDAVRTRERAIESERKMPFGGLTAYLGTKNLHVLYFGQVAVLLDRRGFATSTDAEFTRFLYDVLSRAAKESSEKPVKKALLKALARLDVAEQDVPG